MRKLTKMEWIAVAVAVIFVGYTLFGSNIISLFQSNKMDENSAANVNAALSFNNGGVSVKDITVGNGAEIKAGDVVSVHYLLSLQDGTLIQDSKQMGTPFQFIMGAGQVIPGWEQGISGMKVGGVRQITIPPELGYGAQQVGPIPANSTLVFNIELINTAPAPSQATQ